MSLPPPDRVVQTVLGPIDPADLGVTMAHEHLWMDSTRLHAVHGCRAVPVMRDLGLGDDALDQMLVRNSTPLRSVPA